MWEDVRRCEKMWEDVRRCEKMWRMRRWGEDGRMRRCEDEKMWRCEDVKMRRCEDERMWRWEDVKMRGCEDEKMWRWEDVKMRRCFTDPHYWKNPALRRSREKTIQKSDKMLSHNVGRNFDSKTKLRRVHMQASGKAVNKSPFLRSFILSHLQ